MLNSVFAWHLWKFEIYNFYVVSQGTPDTELVHNIIKSLDSNLISPSRDSKKFACNICDLQFTHSFAYSQHLQSKKHCQNCSVDREKVQIKTEKEDLLPCPLCEATFKFSESLENHLRKRHNAFKCTICPSFVTKKKENMARHLRAHKKLSSEQRMCSVCFAVCNSRSELYAHRKEFHTILSKSCELPELLPGKSTVRSPVELEDNQRSVSAKDVRKEVTKVPVVATYPCERCSLNFEDKSMLWKHPCKEQIFRNVKKGHSKRLNPKKKRSLKNTNHVCISCYRQFSSLQELKKHAPTCLPKAKQRVKQMSSKINNATLKSSGKINDLQCGKCSVKFEDDDLLSEHFQLCSGVKMKTTFPSNDRTVSNKLRVEVDALCQRDEDEQINRVSRNVEKSSKNEQSVKTLQQVACDQCGLIYNNAFFLQKHVQEVHPPSRNPRAYKEANQQTRNEENEVNFKLFWKSVNRKETISGQSEGSSEIKRQRSENQTENSRSLKELPSAQSKYAPSVECQRLDNPAENRRSSEDLVPSVNNEKSPNNTSKSKYRERVRNPVIKHNSRGKSSPVCTIRSNARIHSDRVLKNDESGKSSPVSASRSNEKSHSERGPRINENENSLPMNTSKSKNQHERDERSMSYEHKYRNSKSEQSRRRSVMQMPYSKSCDDPRPRGYENQIRSQHSSCLSESHRQESSRAEYRTAKQPEERTRPFSSHGNVDPSINGGGSDSKDKQASSVEQSKKITLVVNNDRCKPDRNASQMPPLTITPSKKEAGRFDCPFCPNNETHFVCKPCKICFRSASLYIDHMKIKHS